MSVAFNDILILRDVLRPIKGNPGLHRFSSRQQFGLANNPRLSYQDLSNSRAIVAAIKEWHSLRYPTASTVNILSYCLYTLFASGPGTAYASRTLNSSFPGDECSGIRNNARANARGMHGVLQERWNLRLRTNESLGHVHMQSLDGYRGPIDLIAIPFFQHKGQTVAADGTLLHGCSLWHCLRPCSISLSSSSTQLLLNKIRLLRPTQKTDHPHVEQIWNAMQVLLAASGVFFPVAREEQMFHFFFNHVLTLPYDPALPHPSSPFAPGPYPLGLGF